MLKMYLYQFFLDIVLETLSILIFHFLFFLDLVDLFDFESRAFYFSHSVNRLSFSGRVPPFHL